MFCISSKKLSLFSRYSNFYIFVFPFFIPVSHFFRGWFKKNLHVYDIINCLNKNVVTYFVWYLEKEIRCDVETLSIDRVLNTEHFLWKNYAENEHQKLAPDPYLILLTQNSHCMQEIVIKIRFWKIIVKNL